MRLRLTTICSNQLRLCLLVFFVLASSFAAPGWAQAASGCVGTTQNMPLSPNSRSSTTASGDINSDTQVTLQINGQSYWFALLSSANIALILGKDVGNAVVTFKKGLSLNMVMNSPSEYLVLLSGTIMDDMTEYNLTGKVIAVFHCTQVSQLMIDDFMAPPGGMF